MSSVVQAIISTNKLVSSSNKELVENICDAFQQAKAHQLPYELSYRVSTVPLELVHMDVCGPAVKSSGGFSYYVSFLDDFSKFLWIYLLKHESDVEHVFYQFQKHVERSLGVKILSVQSDWGGEYQKLHRYFQNTGITHRLSCPHTHQQNGAIERKHCHLVETALALLAQACYLINRMPSRVIHNETPVTKLFNIPVRYEALRGFGCACWPNLRPYNNRKLSFRSIRCVFLGYSPDHLGFKCLDRSTGRIYISRDVVFDETIYPFSIDHSQNSQPTEDLLLLPDPARNSSMCNDMDCATNPVPSIAVSGAGAPVDSSFHGVHVPPDDDHGAPDPAAPDDHAAHNDVASDTDSEPASPPTPARGPAYDADHDSPAPSPSASSSPSPSPAPAPAPTHPMRTRLQNNKVRLVRLYDGII
jgi:hypothetical protein